MKSEEMQPIKKTIKLMTLAVLMLGLVAVHSMFYSWVMLQRVTDELKSETQQLKDISQHLNQTAARKDNKDLASHLVRHQHASNVVNETQMPLKKVTNELRSQTQQLKDALQLLNKTAASIDKKVYGSCKEILDDKPGSADGVYQLRSGKHYCVMRYVHGCGAGGWTLVMKVNGSKDTFKARSSYWTTDNVYNVEDGLQSFETEESKFPGFNNIRMQSICMGIKVKGMTKWIKAAKSSTSLFDVFKAGTYQPTSLGRSKWLSLISGSELQANCNREGFNVQTPGLMYARIGIMANQENDCHTPDSFVGLGTAYRSSPILWCNRGLAKISCGNFVACHSKDQSIAAMGFIMIK